MKRPPSTSYQYAASARLPAIRIAARSLNETPTTRERGERAFSRSPTVKPSKRAGDAARPLPPRGWTVSSPTTFTRWRSARSYQLLWTMPELRGDRPESRTEWPGPVEVQAWRKRAFVNTAPRSISRLKPPV